MTSGPVPRPGPDRDDVLLELENRLERARRDRAFGGLVERHRHVFGAHRRDDRLRAARRRDADETRAGPQRADGGQMRGAGLAARARR